MSAKGQKRTSPHYSITSSVRARGLEGHPLAQFIHGASDVRAIREICSAGSRGRIPVAG
jgi:hypothetical protein